MEPAIIVREESGVWDLPEDILPALRQRWKTAKAASLAEPAPIPVGATCLYSGIGGMAGRLVRVLGVYKPEPLYLHCEVLGGRDRAPTGETFGCHPNWLRQVTPPPGHQSAFL